MEVVPAKEEKIIVYYSDAPIPTQMTKMKKSMVNGYRIDLMGRGDIPFGEVRDQVIAEYADSIDEYIELQRWEIRRGIEKPSKGFAPMYVYESARDALVAVSVSSLEVPELVATLVQKMTGDRTVRGDHAGRFEHLRRENAPA